MDTKALEQVAEMIASLGEQGRSAFVMWLSFHYGLGMLKVLAFIGGLCFVVTRIYKLVLLEYKERS